MSPFQARTLALAGVVTLTLAATPALASPGTAHARATAAKAGTCFGKKPTVVLRAKGARLTLGKTTKNAVVDLLGKGESVNAAKARGNTYVCDTGGARSIVTGDGNDKVSVKNGSPSISTGKGNDTVIQLGTGNPVIHLGAGVDVGTLGKGNGTLYGDDGNDTLRAGSSGKQKVYGGHGHDTLVAGGATSTLDGQDGGTAYLVAAAFAGHTTVVLHPGDTVNGKVPASTPAPTPAPTPTPTPPPAPAPDPTLPTGTIVSFGTGSAPNVTTAASGVDLRLTGAPGSGRFLKQWSLDFGDGNPVHSGIGVPPSDIGHVYIAAGVYTATLTLTDDLGRSIASRAGIDVSGDDTASVTVPTAPTGSQTATTISLTVKSTPGQRAGFVMSSIDFGDGSAPILTNGAAPSTLAHTYAAPGSYVVYVFEADNHGGETSADTSVNIVDTAAHPILTDDTGSVLSTVRGTAGATTYFDATRSVGTGTGALTTLSLDPGDGSAVRNLLIDDAGGANVTYNAGSYTATLTAASGSSTVSVKYPVYVSTPSTASISGAGTPVTAVAGTPVSFTTAATLGTPPTGGPANKVVSDLVDFGDDTAEAAVTGTAVTHTFATPGVYDVFDNLTDYYGGPGQATALVVTVTQSTPTLQFGIGSYPYNSPWTGTQTSPTSGPTTYASLLGIGSTGHLGATYRIDWGDGSTPSTGMVSASTGSISTGDIAHGYAGAGEFTATATLTDSANLVKTVSQHVSVSTPSSVTLGTPTVSGGVLTQPVTSFSPGSNGAVADSYTITVLDKDENYYSASGDGAPSSLSVPVPGGSGPFEVDVYYATDRGHATASATTS